MTSEDIDDKEPHPDGIMGEDHHHLCDISISAKKKLSSAQTISNLNQNVTDVESSPWKKVLVSLIAGAVAGAVAKTVIAPLDRTKILFQTSDMQFSARKAAEVLHGVYRKGGYRALFRGNSATMARIIPYAAVQYASHEHYKKILNPSNATSLDPLPRFVAGSLAGVTASSLTYPLDLIRARMAVTHRKSNYRGLYSIIVQTFTKEGPGTFYRGYLPTVLGVIPYGGISFFTYDTFKKRHREKHKGAEPSPLQRLVYGAIAGLFGQSASYPLDVVRRRMQTAGITKYSYDTIINTAKDIVREGGIVGGLYKGLSMNWIKGPIAVGISFTMYDLTSKALKETSIFCDT